MFGGGPATKRLRYDPEDMGGAVGYAAWASRYLVESNTRRDQWRYVALNARANAQLNPLAAMRDPITAQEYADARLVREPFCLFDMDLPVDGADAFILTSAARASDLTDNPVLVHAATAGITAPCEEDQAPSLRNHGQQVVAKKLRQQSEIWLDSVDLFYPYDGFTSIALAWFENIGWCGFGDAGPFLESHWNDATGRILIDGRIPVNTHGGQLAEGASQASGHVREAVTQLQGRAGDRQVTGAKTALLTLGGFFKNSQGVILRRP
jgi:acetyl-CoA acetyltransferase